MKDKKKVIMNLRTFRNLCGVHLFCQFHSDPVDEYNGDKQMFMQRHLPMLLYGLWTNACINSNDTRS